MPLLSFLKKRNKKLLFRHFSLPLLGYEFRRFLRNKKNFYAALSLYLSGVFFPATGSPGGQTRHMPLYTFLTDALTM
jgi:hypothetical protein